jgi:hypothetical protein
MFPGWHQVRDPADRGSCLLLVCESAAAELIERVLRVTIIKSYALGGLVKELSQENVPRVFSLYIVR